MRCCPGMFDVVALLVVGAGLANALRPADGTSEAEGHSLRFTKQRLMLSPNEGCALADVDNDGTLDVIAGTHWFANPEFSGRPIRDIEEFDNDFLHNNGDHPYDVNGDGWIDVISGAWLRKEIYWYQNPGPDGHRKGLKWKQHLLKETRGEKRSVFPAGLGR